MKAALLSRGGAIVVCFLAASGFGQPANDNYTNRTVLTGNDISFSGTLAGATFETNPYELLPSSFFSPVTQTVWWEWTPTQSTTVIIEILNPSTNSERHDIVQVYQDVQVQPGCCYTADYVAKQSIDTRIPRLFFSFQAQAGTNYAIQLLGSDSVSFNFRLVATNLPFIIEQPFSQMIRTNDSVMFGVTAAGARPFGYQWQYFGTNLPGETAPILALDHVARLQSGPYRVVITNAAGTNISDTADLLVSRTNLVPILTTLPASDPAGFTFTLLGQVGCRYRVQSSTNLKTWSSETSFPSTFLDNNAPAKRSVVIDFTGSNSYSLPPDSLQKFFRVRPFQATNEVCNNILKEIRYSLLLTLYTNGGDIFRTATEVGVTANFKNATIPFCPSGGVISVTTMLNNPSCSIHGVTEEP